MEDADRFGSEAIVDILISNGGADRQRKREFPAVLLRRERRRVAALVSLRVPHLLDRPEDDAETKPSEPLRKVVADIVAI